MTAHRNGHPRGHFHGVRFHRSAEARCSLVTDYLVSGLANGEPALVIATTEHLIAILTRLSTAMDVAELQRAGLLIVQDTHDALALVQRDGRIDRRLFYDTVSPTLERLSQKAGRPVRVYGEIVDVLWQQNLRVSALQLELLWNTLASQHEFSLLCGYSANGFQFDRPAAAQVCRSHTHVLSGQWDEAALRA
jgi:hypothetical protein